MAEISGDQLEQMKNNNAPGTNQALVKQQASLQEARTVVYRLSQVLESHPTLEAATEAFLSSLEGANTSRAGLSGVTRARKLATVREYFRFLEAHDLLEKNPANGIETPKKEKKTRIYLSSDEYRLMLSEAAGSPRDYCLLQLFLQLGVRV